MKSYVHDNNKKQPYLVLVIFILVTHISNQTNEMRLEPLGHIWDVAFRLYVTIGTEDACAVQARHVDQSQEIYPREDKTSFFIEKFLGFCTSFP